MSFEREHHRESSSRSSSEHRHVPTLPDLTHAISPPQHARRPSSASVSSSRRQSFNAAGGPAPPHRHSKGFTAEEIVNAMEFEQENIVNRLQKELSTLRAQQDHQHGAGVGNATVTPSTPAAAPPATLSRQSSNRSASRVTTQSSNPSSPAFNAEDRGDFHLDPEVEALRRENEMLKRRIKELNQKLREKSAESDIAQKSALDLKDQLDSLRLGGK